MKLFKAFLSFKAIFCWPSVKFIKVYCLVMLTDNNPFVPPAWLMPSRVFISMPAFTSFYFMLANCKAIASLSRPENQNAPSWAIREIYPPSEFCRHFSKKPTDSVIGCLYLLALRFCKFSCMILALSLYCTLIPCTWVGESAIVLVSGRR